MAKVLVLFDDRTDDAAALADAIAEGAREVRFTEVDVRRLEALAASAALEALAGYDALVLGGPAQPGGVAPALRAFLDRLGPLQARGALADVVGAAFTAGPAANGDHETALASVMMALSRLGMLLVPPAGADLAAARHLGARVAKVAGWVRHAKGHEAADGGHHHHHHH